MNCAEELLNGYKKIEKLNLKLIEELKVLYKYIKENDLRNLDEVDDIVVDKEYQKEYYSYVDEKKKSILSILENNKINSEKVLKLFSIREKMFNFQFENLEVNTIGTALNIASEFYGDVERDLKRNILD